jgi:hypothetical protein
MYPFVAVVVVGECHEMSPFSPLRLAVFNGLNRLGVSHLEQFLPGIAVESLDGPKLCSYTRLDKP